jgi:hypothetical protein
MNTTDEDDLILPPLPWFAAVALAGGLMTLGAVVFVATDRHLISAAISTIGLIVFGLVTRTMFSKYPV